MRLGIRAKQIAAVTATVGLFVVVLSAVYVSQLADAVLGENQKTADLLAKQLFHRAFEVVPGAADPYEAIVNDPGIRSLLESTIFGHVLSGARIVDNRGIVIASDNQIQVGQPVVSNPELSELVNADVLTQLRTIFQGDGPTYEVREAMTLSDEAFGSIRVGASAVTHLALTNNGSAPLVISAISTSAMR